jgi:hypothetical protein
MSTFENLTAPGERILYEHEVRETRPSGAIAEYQWSNETHDPDGEPYE